MFVRAAPDPGFEPWYYFPTWACKICRQPQAHVHTQCAEITRGDIQRLKQQLDNAYAEVDELFVLVDAGEDWFDSMKSVQRELYTYRQACETVLAFAQLHRGMPEVAREMLLRLAAARRSYRTTVILPEYFQAWWDDDLAWWNDAARHSCLAYDGSHVAGGLFRSWRAHVQRAREFRMMALCLRRVAPQHAHTIAHIIAESMFGEK
jgi:hypothetical protein